MARTPPPQPTTTNLGDMFTRHLMGLPADRGLAPGMTPANHAEDTANLRTQTALLKSIWGDTTSMRNSLNRLRLGGPGGSGGGGPGGVGGGLRGWGNRFLHGAAGLRRLGQGLGSGNIGQMASGALQIGRAAAGGGEALGGAGGALGALGPVGAAVGAVALVTTAVVAFTVAMKDAADATIQANRELAKVSPSMAGVYAQRDLQEMMRDRQRGEVLANSTQALTQGEQRFKDETFDISNAWEELKANFLAGFYEELADIAHEATEIAKWLGLIEKRNREKAEDTTFSGQINAIADEAEARQKKAEDRARRAR